MARAPVAPALALLAALPGCGLFASKPSPEPTPVVVSAPTPQAPVGAPSSGAPRAAVEGKDHPAKDREWPLASAPKDVVAAVAGERAAFASADELRALYATPIDVDEDGAAEWLVAAEGEFANVNTPLWVFAERRGGWSNLGFLGAGFSVKKVAGAPPGGAAPLCLFGRDGPSPVATELTWDGARYRSGARYEPRLGGARPCERDGTLAP